MIAERAGRAERPSRIREAMPGIALCGMLGAGALWLHGLPGIAVLSALILAILLGIAVRNTVGVPPQFRAGIAVCLRPVLRLAIVLLGLQLSLQELAQVGWTGFLIVAATLVATLAFTKWLGRVLGIDRKLAQLIAAGTAVCGASAVIAANMVTDGGDEDVAYSVGVVTLFGTASMFLYPLLPRALGLHPASFGIWAGASIHEVAQVVAAAFQDGRVSGQIATVAKLARVMLLAPTVIALGALRTEAPSGPRRSAPVPWFALGFVAMAGIASLGIVPEAAKAVVKSIDLFLMAAALAAMGLETHVARLRAKGARPLLLGIAAWLFISVFSYALVRLGVGS